GFPSGHATAAAAFFGALIYLAGSLRPPARLAVRAASVVLIVLVALARVILRAHWPVDTLAGISLGLSFASLATILSDSYRTNGSRASGGRTSDPEKSRVTTTSTDALPPSPWQPIAARVGLPRSP